MKRVIIYVVLDGDGLFVGAFGTRYRAQQFVFNRYGRHYLSSSLATIQEEELQ